MDDDDQFIQPDISESESEISETEPFDECETETEHDNDKEIEKMPDCAEKSLIGLICLLKNKLRLFETNTVDIQEQLCSKTSELLIRLQNEYTGEERESDTFSNSIREIKDAKERKFALTKDQVETLLLSLSRLLNHLRPLNFEDIFHLIEKTEQSVSQIQGKDIVLVLGKTGAGKSTTIHFLAGSDIQLKGSSHNYIVKNVKNLTNALTQVKISASANSETRYLTSVQVDLEERIGKLGSLNLCDTPGFNDTSGAEVDISNMVGLIKAISKCKSVRPLLLINADGVGGRLEGIIELVQLLNEMISNLKDSIDSFTYVFTKFPAGFDIRTPIQFALTKKDLDEHLKSILLDMSFKLNKNVFQINPLDKSQALDILKHLEKINPIENPHEVFKYFITPNSSNRLKEQYRLHERAIHRALQKGDYDLIAYKLGQLKKFKECMTKMPGVDIDVNSIIQKLFDHFQEVYMLSQTALKNQIENDNKLTKENMNSIKVSLQIFLQIKRKLGDYLGQHDFHKCLLNDLQDQANSICKRIEKHLFENDDNLVWFKNMSTLFEEFPDAVSSTYEKLHTSLCEIYQKRVEVLYAICCEPFAFSQITDHLVILKKLSSCLIEIHSQKREISPTPASCCNHVLSTLKKCVDELISINKQTLCNDEFIARVNSFLVSIEMAENDHIFCSIIPRTDLNAIKQLLYAAFIEKSKKLAEHINQILNADLQRDSISRLKPLYEEITSMRNIGDLENRAHEAFNSRQAIANRLIKFRDVVAVELEKFEKDDVAVNFDIIDVFLNAIANAEWLESINASLYSSSLMKIENDIVKRLRELSDKLKDLDLSVRNYSNLDEAFHLYKRISKMKPLSHNRESIKGLIDSSEKYIKSETTKSFESINSKYSLSNISEEFPKVEAIFIQYTINYANEIRKQACSWLKADQIDTIVETYLQKWIQHIKSDFESAFAFCASPSKTVDNDMLLSINVQKLNNHFRDLETMKSRFTPIYQKLDATSQSDVIEDLENLIKDYANVIGITMAGFERNGENDQLSFYVDYTFALSYLNSKIGVKNYFELLYDRYSAKISEEIKSILDNIKKLLDKNDYNAVSIELSENISKNMSVQYMIQIQNRINISVQHFLETINNKERQITSLFALPLTEGLKKDLDNLKDAETLLNLFEPNTTSLKLVKYNADLRKKVETSFEQIARSLRMKFEKSLVEIETLVESSDYEQAKKRHIEFEDAYYLLKIYINLKSSSHSVSSLDLDQENNRISKLIRNSLEDLEKNFSERDISTYPLRSPKALIAKLQANDTLQPMGDRIKHIIKTKIRNHLNNVNDEAGLEDVKDLLIYLPPDLETVIEGFIEEKRTKIKNQAMELSNEITTMVSQDDVGRLSKFMEANKTKLELIKEARVKILERTRELTNNIQGVLKMGEADKILDDCIKLGSYYENFNDFQMSMAHGFSYVKQELKILYEKFCQNVSSVTRNSVLKTDTEDLEKSLINFLAIKTMAKSALCLIDITPESLDSQLNELIFFLEKNYDDFLSALTNNEPSKVEKAMERSLNYRTVFDKLYKDKTIDNERMEEFHYLKFLSSLAKKLLSFQKTISEDRFDDECIMKYEDLRSDFFKKRSEELKFFCALQNHGKLADLNQVEEHIDCSEIISAINSQIKEKITKIQSSLRKSLESKEMLKEDFENLEFNYNIALSFDEYFTNVMDLGIKDVDTEILEKYENISKKLDDTNLKVKDIAILVIRMKYFSESLPKLKAKTYPILNKKLASLKKSLQEKKNLLEFINELENDEIGVLILSEFGIFKGELIRALYEKTNQHTFKYVLENIKGDAIDEKQLESQYQSYSDEFQKLTEKYIISPTSKSTEESLLKSIQDSRVANNNDLHWYKKFKNKLPKLMAQISVLWALRNKKYYDEMKDSENKDAYLMRLHPVQIITIFRLLGIGYDSSKNQNQSIISKGSVPNNIVQVSTGEGKSVVLAITSCILALCGIDVYCACYSQYLSDRDFENFKDLFDSLDLTSKIKYGTFNKLCEQVLNLNFNIRERTTEFIRKDKNTTNELKKQVKNFKILLIDEVDVFFSNDFLGNLYVPTAQLKDPLVSALFDCIWQKRNQELSLRSIQATEEYKNLKEKFKDWDDLLNEILNDVLDSLKKFKTHEYFVRDDRIAYKDQDSYSVSIEYGYKTMFAYYEEHENGSISLNSLEQNKCLYIRNGCFSYSEIPKRFDAILGVSGTLKTLQARKKELLTKYYNILHDTYMPSIYGKNKLDFKKENYTSIHSHDDYNIRLFEEIQRRMATNSEELKRPVLVFFENKASLTRFYNSIRDNAIRASLNILCEETSSNDKIKFIKDATKAGKITLLTRIFGRGIDFISRNQAIITCGGVHVIQTFLSEDESEEIQIKGRTARQGESGSYSLVLNEQDLEAFFQPSPSSDDKAPKTFKDEIERMRDTNTIYDTLNKWRNDFFDKKNEGTIAEVEEANRNHQKTEDFVKELETASDFKRIHDYLLECNQSVSDIKSRTICLMDATGSMSSLLLSAKNTVCTMFERIGEILSDKKIPVKSFELQFAAYRDYDLKERLLEASDWESDPVRLRKFLEKIEPLGNSTDEEAVEIGLWHVNQVNEQTKVSQALLIGDAPAKPEKQIIDDRNRFGGEEYWQKTKFKKITHYTKEVKQLKENKIPVHTFYVRQFSRTNFEEIAKETGGICAPLDVSTANAVETLTHTVCTRILEDLENSFKGSDLTGEYVRKFVKGHLAS